MDGFEGLVRPAILRIRLVVGALIAGVLVFASIAVLLVRNGTVEPNPGTEQLFRLIVPLLALGCASAFLIFRRSQANRMLAGPERPSTEEWIAASSTRSIVGAALAESVALCAIVGYLVTADDWLLLGVAVALVAMASCLPSVEKLREISGAGGRPV